MMQRDSGKRRYLKHTLYSTCVIACVLLGGCLMTKADGDELRAAQAKQLADFRAETDTREKAIEARITELAAELERAKSLLTRDSADVGSQVQEQQQKLAAVEGKLDEMTHSLTDLIQQTAQAKAEYEDKINKLAAKPGEAMIDAAQVPADKTAHFTAAYDAYKAGDHDKARLLFKEYLTRYADDAKAGDAQYWIGASYVVQNKPATALGEYRKVITLYPKSAAVDTALYGMADAFFRLHACTDAKGAIDALMKRKPSKALEQRSKDLLKAVTGAAKGYCTS